MYQLGIDAGASTIKIVLLEDGVLREKWSEKHFGAIVPTLLRGLSEMKLPKVCGVCITGGNRSAIVKNIPDLEIAEDIPATVSAVKKLVPQAGSIIEIGSQGARFITSLSGKAPQFAVNEHCAGGTGSFFEDQMSRLGMKMEDYSTLVQQAREIPNLSGRCAVFAKTDIIHRQQEGVPKEDILLGLCYAMIRNYKATIVRTLPVEKPVVFAGGVTQNIGVAQAIRSVFQLKEEELIIPEDAVFMTAIGAALQASKENDIDKMVAALCSEDAQTGREDALEKLVLTEGTILSDPEKSERMPVEGAYIGIDIGSTSTDLVLMDADKKLIDFMYLRTAGDPEGVVRRGFSEFQKKYGTFPVRGVGVTGSGRERLGRMMGADAIRDEITAQAKAAVFCVPDADTVFEIGGQDSKYISLKNGEVADFQMNKICAAGTGSFVEEQAARMNLPIGEFGPLALTAEHPCNLGERCTVFIETSITRAEADGASKADIAAGLCHSIVQNYLHKVVGNKPVGSHIVLQGGVDYNPGIVAAFQSAYRDRITVSPVFSISGAIGAALLAQESVGSAGSTFLGFDFPSAEHKVQVSSEEIRRNKAFYKKAGQLAQEDYDGKMDPRKKTIGVPLTLIMFKFFPMVNAFFKNLGYNVVLSKPTGQETIALSQQYARGETCYPVKLIYGHMMQLAQQNVDYIFLPSVHTIKHPHAHAAHSYACPYMQKAGEIIFKSLELDKQGIKLLSPVLDLELGAKMMAKAMLSVGAELGFPKPRCLPGLLKGAAAVNKYTEDVEALGRQMMADLKPEEKVLVLLTRNYGLSDPVLNMGIPEILLNRGYKVMTLGHLPGMSLDLSEDYPNMYWPFGDHILSGAKLIANHPNLYAVYVTNHGCGPDTILSHMFKEEMGDKPYLQIEVDEHFSGVGIITRVEAFLNSLSHRENDPMPSDFNILNVRMRKTNMTDRLTKGSRIYLPDLSVYTDTLEEYLQKQGFETERMASFDSESLRAGRAETNSKEYLPFAAIAGSALRTAETICGQPAENTKGRSAELLIPFSYGGDADGQYARAIRTVLDRRGFGDITIASPMLEELPEKSADFRELFHALLEGDLRMSEQNQPADGGNQKTIAAVGSPLCVTVLNDGVLDRLENAGFRIMRMPLAEMMLFLWADHKTIGAKELEICKREMKECADKLGDASPFAENFDELIRIANDGLSDFAGNQGRYRYAKIISMGKKADAVLAMAPRYENTAMVLNLENVAAKCQAPILELAFDGDWDENSESKLRSFLYYC